MSISAESKKLKYFPKRHLGARRLLKASHVMSFSRYTILEGSKGPLILSKDFITALAGRTLLDGSGEVP